MDDELFLPPVSDVESLMQARYIANKVHQTFALNTTRTAHDILRESLKVKRAKLTKMKTTFLVFSLVTTERRLDEEMIWVVGKELDEEGNGGIEAKKDENGGIESKKDGNCLKMIVRIEKNARGDAEMNVQTKERTGNEFIVNEGKIESKKDENVEKGSKKDGIAANLDGNGKNDVHEFRRIESKRDENVEKGLKKDGIAANLDGNGMNDVSEFKVNGMGRKIESKKDENEEIGLKKDENASKLDGNGMNVVQEYVTMDGKKDVDASRNEFLKENGGNDSKMNDGAGREANKEGDLRKGDDLQQGTGSRKDGIWGKDSKTHGNGESCANVDGTGGSDANLDGITGKDMRISDHAQRDLQKDDSKKDNAVRRDIRLGNQSSHSTPTEITPITGFVHLNRAYFGGFVQGTICSESFSLVAVHLCIKTPQGEFVRVELYNVFPVIGSTQAQIIAAFPVNAVIKIHDPFFKPFLDEHFGIRCDDPSKVEIDLPSNQGENPFEVAARAMESKDWLLANRYLSKALLSQRQSDIVSILKNRAETNLRLDRNRAALRDADLALTMSPPCPVRTLLLEQCARACFAMGDYNRAVQFCSSSISQTNYNSFHSQSQYGLYDFDTIFNDPTQIPSPEIASFIGPIQVANTPGNERILVVSRDVKQGELLVVENPLAYSKSTEFKLIAKNFETGQSDVLSSVDTLSKLIIKSMDDYWLLAATFALSDGTGSRRNPIPDFNAKSTLPKLYDVDVSRIRRVIKTNAYSLKENEDDQPTALYYMLSFANHSCAPSARMEFFSNKTAVVRATRDLKQGQEVTVSYATFKPMSNTEERREVLSNWGFTCLCDMCKLEDKLVAELGVIQPKVTKMMDLGNVLFRDRRDFVRALKAFCQAAKIIDEVLMCKTQSKREINMIRYRLFSSVYLSVKACAENLSGMDANILEIISTAQNRVQEMLEYSGAALSEEHCLFALMRWNYSKTRFGPQSNQANTAEKYCKNVHRLAYGVKNAEVGMNRTEFNRRLRWQ